MFKKLTLPILGAAVAMMIADVDRALAEEAKTTEAKYIFNSINCLMCGFLVMFMAAGFAMLESGLVRAKNTATICLKNVSLYSVAGIM